MTLAKKLPLCNGQPCLVFHLVVPMASKKIVVLGLNTKIKVMEASEGAKLSVK
jgi:hypothetical protein